MWDLEKGATFYGHGKMPRIENRSRWYLV